MVKWKAKDWPNGKGLTLAGEYPEGGRWFVVELEAADVGDILELLNGAQCLWNGPLSASPCQMVPLDDDGFGDVP